VNCDEFLPHSSLGDLTSKQFVDNFKNRTKSQQLHFWLDQFSSEASIQTAGAGGVCGRETHSRVGTMLAGRSVASVNGEESKKENLGEKNVEGKGFS